MFWPLSLVIVICCKVALVTCLYSDKYPIYGKSCFFLKSFVLLNQTNLSNNFNFYDSAFRIQWQYNILSTAWKNENRQEFTSKSCDFIETGWTCHFLCIKSHDQLILFMLLVWLDLRTQSTVERLLKRIPGKNKTFSKVGNIPEHLKGSCCNI